jgi:hypothetical protein
MKDNYLWDRSGEPDPEVQQLEEVLGTLRYQPRPLRIPANIQIRRRRNFVPALAIAAAITLLAVTLGIWFSLNRRQAPRSLEANTSSPIEQKSNDKQRPQVLPKNPPAKEVAAEDQKPTGNQDRHRESARHLLAANKTRRTRTEIRQPELTPQEIADKQQVLIALRLVSAKLNVAQRKAQGAPPLNVIRNQHRIG